MANEKQITTTEAQSTLESLSKIGNETISSLRPPLWLIIIMSLLSGIFTFSWCATEHENMWALGMWSSGISIFLLVLFYRYSERLLGVRGNLLPSSGRGKVFPGLQMLSFAAVMFVGRAATVWGRPEIRIEGAFPTTDLPLAPYIAAIIASLGIAYLTYMDPTNEGVQVDAPK